KYPIIGMIVRPILSPCVDELRDIHQKTSQKKDSLAACYLSKVVLSAEARTRTSHSNCGTLVEK
ncbi:hypothetical protein, partial [Endozoicomonas sp. ONNA2]|uniref:hypothetical protein n=1 Tax=Endozoicomonas sp. ONNA2 TaxID=2828741 RepID=UPI0021482757